MDPEEALRLCRESAQRILDGEEKSFDPAMLAESFTALDEWISRGGFLPEAWQPQAPSATATATSRRG